MEDSHCSYPETGRFSKLMSDYLAGSSSLEGLYRYRPDENGLLEALKDRSQVAVDRATLVTALKAQYASEAPSSKTLANIDALSSEGSFTVTTGHQLCLFGGPLYFLYKILTVIKMAEEMNQKHPEHTFVPVFWMATEDHDFEEISFFRPFGKKLTWELDAAGPVGHLSTNTLEEVKNQLKEILGDRPQAASLMRIFENAYAQNSNLSAATRKLVMALFDAHGLVILDGDDASLKDLAADIFKKELLEGHAFNAIQKSNAQLDEQGYHQQVHAREINLFYMKTGLRSRIVREGEQFQVLNTELAFSENELLAELAEHPERFSPNVIIRPVYQERILPNIAYVGGGGELAYWFQLKDVLESYTGYFPVLWLRNSFLWLDGGALKRMRKLGLSDQDIFVKEEDLVKKWLKSNASVELDFEDDENQLKSIYQGLSDKAEQIDKTLAPAIQAELQRQLKALDGVGKRLVRAEKKRQEVGLNQLTGFLSKYFPEGGLQERHDHFAALWMTHEQQMVDELLQHTDPFAASFTILKEQ